MSSIWWIRRDLRLQDNLTLHKALENPPILPVFILDPLLLKNAPERRLNFLFQNLQALDK
ncbi:MAG: deoxyribodipyrimidine photo-lyase, partial [Anaerolineales bacterium]|nr:deoxyribodipyrimidine photo-lyase [Anaerolineales bacterium]